MTDNQPGSQNWWQTLPGMLTGLAAVITAVTGLIVAFHRTSDADRARRAGARNAEEISAPATVVGSRVRPGPNRQAATAPATSPTSSQTVRLPAGMEVKLAGGQTAIKILSAQVEPFNAEKRALRFVVRYTNHGRYPANFWSASYRLIVDDVPRAPTNFLDEVVPADSATEGEVVFEVPATVGQVVLQISAGDDKTRLPFDLRGAER